MSDRQCESHRDRGVHGIAAGFQDCDADVGGVRFLGHHHRLARPHRLPAGAATSSVRISATIAASRWDLMNPDCTMRSGSPETRAHGPIRTHHRRGHAHVERGDLPSHRDAQQESHFLLTCSCKPAPSPPIPAPIARRSRFGVQPVAARVQAIGPVAVLLQLLERLVQIAHPHHGQNRERARRRLGHVSVSGARAAPAALRPARRRRARCGRWPQVVRILHAIQNHQQPSQSRIARAARNCARAESHHALMRRLLHQAVRLSLFSTGPECAARGTVR